MKRTLASFGKKVLPASFVEWYRRRRALRRYLKQLGWELYNRRSQLDPEELEGRLAAARDGFYQGLVRDVLERIDLVLQQLDRRIEGVTARHSGQIRDLRAEVDALRQRVAALLEADAALGGSDPVAPDLEVTPARPGTQIHAAGGPGD